MISALLYVLFCAACSVLAFVRHPVYGLYFYLATIYVHPPSRWWGYMVPDLRWALLSAGVVTLAIVLNRGRLATKPVWLANGAARLLALYALLLVVQSTWALDLDTHLGGTVQYLKYLVAFWFFYRICDTIDSLRECLWAHTLGCTLLGVYCQLVGREGDRLDGVGGPGIDDANTLGMYLATGVVVAMGLFLGSKGWRRWVLLGCLAVIGNGFVLANSRGAFLGVVAGMGVLALCKARSHRRMFWLIAVIGLVGAVNIIDTAFIERMFTIGDVTSKSEDAERSARSRVAIMEAQLRMAQDYPFGAGHRGTATLSTRYLDREWLTGGGVADDAERSSHNTFMSALVEQGVIGALLYLCMVGWVMWAVVRLRQVQRWPIDPELITLGAACCGALVVIHVAGNATDYLLAEVQFWLYASLVSMMQLADQGQQRARADADHRVGGDAALAHPAH